MYTSGSQIPKGLGNTALHVAYWGNKPVAAALLDSSKKRGLKLEAVKNAKVCSRSVLNQLTKVT